MERTSIQPPIGSLAVLLIAVAALLAVSLDLEVGWNEMLVCGLVLLASISAGVTWRAHKRALSRFNFDRQRRAKEDSLKRQRAVDELRRLADEIYVTAEVWLRSEMEITRGFASATMLKPTAKAILVRIRRIEEWSERLDALQIAGLVSARLETSHHDLTIALAKLALAWVRQRKGILEAATALDALRIGSGEWKEVLQGLGNLAADREAIELKGACGGMVSALEREWQESLRLQPAAR